MYIGVQVQPRGAGAAKGNEGKLYGYRLPIVYLTPDSKCSFPAEV